MAKYDYEFKLKIVKDYLNGTLRYKLLAEKDGIPSTYPIRLWVLFYNEYGQEGLRRKRSREVYLVQFNLDVLHSKKQTGASYYDTASAFKINNPSLIAKWNTKFLKEGVEGLLEKTKGWPSMSKNKKGKPKKQDANLSREKLLERENELLRLEVGYLKKLDAFRRIPMPYSKSTNSVGIRTQRRRIQIKRCVKNSRHPRGNLSLSYKADAERRSR